MFKDYYQILGVDRMATEEEIKRSFRQLAMEYHPDSNQMPGSHERFLAINEAYQVLGDSSKRGLYNFKYDGYKNGKVYSTPSFHAGSSTKTPPQDPYQDRPTQEQYEAWQAAMKRKAKAQNREFSQYVPWVRLVALIGILLSFGLALDYLLIQPSPVQTVRGVSLTFGPGRELSAMAETDDYSFLLDPQKADRLGRGDQVIIHKTPYMDIVTEVEVWKPMNLQEAQLRELYRESKTKDKQGPDTSFYPHYGIYNIFSFFLVGLVIASIMGLVIQNRPGFLFKMGLLNIFLLILTIVITLQS